MQRIMLRAKIHRAIVTDANVNYEGSIAIDEKLMELTGILEYEQVQIYDIANGNRFVTYTIKAPTGSGTVSVNGAAARKVGIGDRIIIASYAVMEEQRAKNIEPKIIYVKTDNITFSTNIKADFN
jgi:aspartate 1-decarboxylase